MKKYITDILTGTNKKYSATKSAGVIVILVGTASFIFATVIQNIEILQAAVWFVSLGAALLGVRNVFQPKVNTVNTEVQPTEQV